MDNAHFPDAPAWPEAAPQAVGSQPGHNRPPMDVEARSAFNELLDKRDGFRKMLEDIVESADRVEIKDDNSLGNAGEVVKQLRGAIKVINAAHSEAKAPYLAASRAVDEAKKLALRDLELAKEKIEAKQDAYVAERDKTKAMGDLGATVSAADDWQFEIIDWDLTYMAVSDNEVVREAMKKAVAGRVRAGDRKIDGVRIFNGTKAITR